MKMHKYLLLTGLLLSFAACSDYLDQVPEEKLSEEALFKSKDDAVSVLTQAYESFETIHRWHYETPGFAADALDIIWNNYDPYRKDVGEFGPSTPIYSIWGKCFAAIRTCTYFLDRINECQDVKLDEQTREWWKGEAYFLKAYYNYLMFSQYGPLPIIDKVYQGDELASAMEEGIARASVDETVNYIDSLCVEAMNRLDNPYALPERVGRANKSAAAFLRARLALYAASPLYNGMVNPTTAKNYSGILSLKNDKGEELMNSEFSAEKWGKALDYTEAAITIAQAGGFNFFMGDATYTGAKAYKRLFTYPLGGEPNKECIFFKRNLTTSDIIQHCLPTNWGSWTGFCPTLEHLGEYFMANGLMTGDDANYQNATGFTTYQKDGYTIHLYNKFKMRDPRFYTNILFPEQYSYAVLFGENESYDTKWGGDADKSRIFYLPYVDGPAGYNSKTGRNFSSNGILCLKYVAYNATAASHGAYTINIFRYTELLLNQMEAAFEYDVAKGIDPLTDNKIFDPWNMIRDRIGMQHVKDAYANAGIPLTIDKLRTLIHTERRVELAFEGHRFHDNRRWLDAEREGGDKHGFDIMKNFDDGFWNEIAFETRYWDDKVYFMPIPQWEIDKNPKMTQNPRY